MKVYELTETAEDQALKSIQKTLPKLQKAFGAGQEDKVVQYMGSAVKKMAAMNLGDKLLNMFSMWATTIKKGIDDGVYPADKLPQMQKAYDSIMAKMPELGQLNNKTKQYMAKQNSKLDTKGNYKGTNIKPTAQQLDRMEATNETSSSSVASVAKPMGTMISRNMYNKNGTMKNGLDSGNLLGSKKSKKLKKVAV
jgi:hypothetical protein